MEFVKVHTLEVYQQQVEITKEIIRPDDTLFEKGSKASAGEINGDSEKIFIFDDDFIIPAGETKAIFNVTAENAGEEYAKNFSLSPETIENLQSLMISKEDYIKNIE